MNEPDETVNDRATSVLASAIDDPPPEQASTDIYDFDDADDLITALNQQISMINQGGRIRVLLLTGDKAGEHLSVNDAGHKFANWRYWPPKAENAKVDPKPVNGLYLWKASPERREFSAGTEFQPDLSKANPNAYNLFTGFAVDPKPGDTPLLDAYLLNDLAGGDQERLDYALRFGADIVQNPGRKCGTTLILRGPEGAGKSTFSELMAQLIGEQYCQTLDDPNGLTPSFNEHLEKTLLIQVEEGFWAGDRSKIGRLNNLTTGRKLLINPKGSKAYTAPSYCRIIMTTNEAMVAPVAGVGRRNAIYDVSHDHVGEQHKPYWDALHAEIEAGGRAAFMAKLMAVDLTGWNPQAIPSTLGLAENARMSLAPADDWWGSILESGIVPDGSDDGDYWPLTIDKIVERRALFEAFKSAAPGYRAPPTMNAMGRLITRLCPGATYAKLTTTNDARVNAYRLPTRQAAIDQFHKVHPRVKLVVETTEDIVADPIAVSVADLAAERAARAN
ncbi:MAG: primase-helicase family protein [Cypionkella sp.]